MSEKTCLLNGKTETAHRKSRAETAFGCPRDFLNNRFVYAVVSPRARGLSVGVNMNPDKYCNFDCAYCEVNRCLPSAEPRLDLEVMAFELQHTLELIRSGRIREFSHFGALPDELLRLRHVALSGDGEPTLCPVFAEAVETIVHLRARTLWFFKLVLITNATELDLPGVQQGLQYLTAEDEVWVKLEAGTQAYMDRVNRPRVPLEKVLANIQLVGRQRPVIVQSLFPMIDRHEPPAEEIEQYALRLRELKEAGTQISLVQIYSATRPTPNSACSHLPLRTLARIAQTVRNATGLDVEVF